MKKLFYWNDRVLCFLARSQLLEESILLELEKEKQLSRVDFELILFAILLLIATGFYAL